MHYFTTYTSPLGEILLTSDDEGLTHLAFDGQKYFPALTGAQEMPSHPILISAQRWLDSYFAGENPELTPPLHASGSNFQRAVWQLLLAIPYGETTTYGAIAQEIARLQQRSRMSAQLSAAPSATIPSASSCPATASSALAAVSPATPAASIKRSPC